MNTNVAPSESSPNSRRWAALALALAWAVIAVLAVAAIEWEFKSVRATAQAQLRGVADLRQTQVQDWLRQHLASGRFLASSDLLAGFYADWLQRGDKSSLSRLMDRLLEMGKADDSGGALILDEHGEAVTVSDPARSGWTPELGAAAQAAMSSTKVTQTGLYRVPAPGTSASMRLDIVAPLVRTGVPIRGAVALAFDADKDLYPMLRALSGASASGETVLWRRTGGQLQVLSELRFAPGSAGVLTRAVGDAALPLARFLRRDVKTDRSVSGLDYRGVAVTAEVRPIADTDWWLVTKLDQSEIDAPAWLLAHWIVGFAVVLMLALATATKLISDRAALRASKAELAQQKQSLRALQLLNAIAENASDVIFAKDADGCYLFYNRAACEEVGRTAEEVIGRDDTYLFPIDVARRLRENDARVMRSGRNETFEETIQTPRGKLVNLSIKGPLRDADGRVIGTFGINRDITDRRTLLDELERHRHHLEDLVQERTRSLQQANEQLVTAERFLRKVADHVPGRLAYWDRDLKLQFANAGFYAWFDRRAGDLIGTSFKEFADEASFEQVRHHLESALSGEEQQFERETRREDGELHYHQLHYVPDRLEDGSVEGVFVVAYDVTTINRARADLQRLNTELVQARNRAEAADRAKTAFLANMSHEMRTPMNAILGLSGLLQRELTERRHRDRLAKVIDAGQHLLEIINDVLDLSKIEAGRLDIEAIEFALDPVLQRALGMVTGAAHEKGLELVVDVARLPERVVGDPTRVAQALLNLLSNAVKFTARGWVRLTGEMLEQRGSQVRLRLSVEDCGIGIAPERQGSLFSPFEQVDNSTTRQYGGTGLGLALTQRLAHLMGGEVGVRSAPGAGSCFWFTAWLGIAGAAPAAEPALQGRRMLVLETSPRSLEALAEQLRAFGIQVTSAGAVEEALALARRSADTHEQFDALLIGADGSPDESVRTLARLRTTLGDLTMSAIFMAGVEDETLVSAARTAGYAMVLAKPIMRAALRRALLQLLDGGTPSAFGALAPAPLDRGDEHALRALGARVLVVDDSPINQEVALHMLSAAGVEADSAQSGEQALELASTTSYSAILMDVQMPGMSGLDATKELRRRGKNMPIIAMTANAFSEDRDACLEAGMNDHLGKPVTPEDLYATLHRWLSRRP